MAPDEVPDEDELEGVDEGEASDDVLEEELDEFEEVVVGLDEVVVVAVVVGADVVVVAVVVVCVAAVEWWCVLAAATATVPVNAAAASATPWVARRSTNRPRSRRSALAR